jgi:hypothetical protein
MTEARGDLITTTPTATLQYAEMVDSLVRFSGMPQYNLLGRTTKIEIPEAWKEVILSG